MRVHITIQSTVSPDSLGLVQQAPANQKSTPMTVDCEESYQRTFFSAFKHQITYVLGERIVQRKKKTGGQPNTFLPGFRCLLAWIFLLQTLAWETCNLTRPSGNSSFLNLRAFAVFNGKPGKYSPVCVWWRWPGWGGVIEYFHRVDVSVSAGAASKARRCINV